MSKWMSGGVAAVFGLVIAAASALPASAQLARPQTAATIAGANDLVTDVQWRRGGGYGWRGGGYGWRGGYGYRRWYGPGIGFATGLAIGGALAAPYYYAPGPRVYYDDYDDAPTVYQAPVAGGDAVAYCRQRFRSYDPSSGTYLGHDGRRHPCP
jgi:BA14K-like protein